MLADLQAFLTLENVRQASHADLLAAVTGWIAAAKPECLKHPHGFYVVLLKRSATQEWRLHLWPPGVREITGMPAKIHTHDKHIDSWLLAGSLTNIDYIITNCIDGQYPLYEVAYEGDRYSGQTINRLKKTEKRINVEIKRSRTFAPGMTYHVERNSFHEATSPIEQATCTLVCMHSQAPCPINVVGIDGYPDDVTFSRTKHSGEVYLLNLLGKNQ